jgi:hypothetical protein
MLLRVRSGRGRVRSGRLSHNKTMFRRLRCACRYRRSRADSKKAPASGRAIARSPPRRVLAEPLPARAPALGFSGAYVWANPTFACSGLAPLWRAFNLVRLTTQSSNRPMSRQVRETICAWFLKTRSSRSSQNTALLCECAKYTPGRSLLRQPPGLGTGCPGGGRAEARL